MQQQHHILFVVNPISGTSNKNTILKKIGKYLDADLFQYEIAFTEYQGHATEIASKAVDDKVDVVCAIGGDGTVNEVASALVNTHTALAIIPCGSGNGLARHLRIPRAPVKAIKLINQFEKRTIDTGRVNDHPFFCTCGMGLDAYISQKFAESGKRGFLSYIQKVLKHALSYPPEEYVIDLDENGTNRHLEVKAAVVSCANASQYGNNVYIAPGASVSDGLMDMVIVEPYNTLEATQMGIQIMNGNLLKNRRVKSYRCTKAVIRRQKEGPIHYDGDPMMAGVDIIVELLPKSLDVVCGGKEGQKSKGESSQNAIS